MLKIGITGGIGCGKSTICKIFETIGVPVLYADDIAKNLMQTNNELIAKIKAAFGVESYNNNILNTKYIANQVFNNSKKLTLLNSIVHPYVFLYFDEWQAKQTAPYTIKEAALLIESGSYKTLDYLIGVQTPMAIRIKRVMQRDNLSNEEVMQRMAKQLSEEEKLLHCAFIINNDETELLLPQVLKIHEQIIKLIV